MGSKGLFSHLVLTKNNKYIVAFITQGVKFTNNEVVFGNLLVNMAGRIISENSIQNIFKIGAN